MLTKGDFHIHSTASDGCLDPEEIIITAKERGLDIIAITDHNTIKGIEKAVIACRKHNFSIIPAVELSTRYNNESIHILGYFKSNICYQNTLEYSLEAVKAHKAHKVRKILKISSDEKSSPRYLSIPEGIYLLRQFGASVVLAHPARIKKKHLKDILRMQFDGLEAKYCLNSVDETKYFVNLAKTRFSFYTGGSDFHTNKRKDLKHCVIGSLYLEAKEIQKFIRRSGVQILS